MAIVYLRIQDADRFEEIPPVDTEDAEITIESIVGTALLEIFDTVLIENVTVSYPAPNEPAILNMRVKAGSPQISLPKSNVGQSTKISDSGKMTSTSPEELRNSIAEAVTDALEKPFGTVKVENVEVLDTHPDSSSVRIGINEEPLTAYNLNTTIAALTELHTKFYLIQQRRFFDLIDYTQTHNPRFAIEANLLIGKMAHNSPGWLDFITVHGTVITDALKSVTAILQTPLQLQASELDNEAKELEMKMKEQAAKSELADKKQNRQIAAQKAELENEKIRLELEDKRLELKKKQLELQEKHLELEKKRVEVALEIAHKAVDIFPLDIDAAAKAMIAESLLPNILQLGTVSSAELIQVTQDNEDKNGGDK